MFGDLSTKNNIASSSEISSKPATGSFSFGIPTSSSVSIGGTTIFSGVQTTNNSHVFGSTSSFGDLKKGDPAGLVSTNCFGQNIQQPTDIFGHKKSIFPKSSNNLGNSSESNLWTYPNYNKLGSGFGNRSREGDLGGGSFQFGKSMFGTPSKNWNDVAKSGSFETSVSTIWNDTSKLAQPPQEVKNPFSFGFSNSISNNIHTKGGNEVDVLISISENERPLSSSGGIGTLGAKFNPVEGIDTMFRGGATMNVQTKFNVITVMKEYENQSIEEIRLKDYCRGKGWTRKEEQMGSWTRNNEHSQGLCPRKEEQKPQEFRFGFHNNPWIQNSADRGIFVNKPQENKPLFDTKPYESPFQSGIKCQDSRPVFGTTQNSGPLMQPNATSCQGCNAMVKNAVFDPLFQQQIKNDLRKDLFNNYANCETTKQNQNIVDPTWKPFVSAFQSREGFSYGNKAGESSYAGNVFSKPVSYEVKHEIRKQINVMYSELKKEIDLSVHKAVAQIVHEKDDRIKNLEGAVKDLENEKELLKCNMHPSQVFGARAKYNNNKFTCIDNQHMNDITESFNRLKEEATAVKSVILEILTKLHYNKDNLQDYVKDFTAIFSANSSDSNETSDSLKVPCDDIEKLLKSSVNQLEEEMKLFKIDAHQLNEKVDNINLKCKVSEKDNIQDIHICAKNIRESVKTVLEEDENIIEIKNTVKSIEKELMNTKHSKEILKMTKDEVQAESFNEEKQDNDTSKHSLMQTLMSEKSETDTEMRIVLKGIQDDLQILKTHILEPKKEQELFCDWSDGTDD